METMEGGTGNDDAVIGSSPCPAPQTESLEAVLRHVTECQTICQKLQVTLPSTFDPDDPTPSLLLLYEFEACLHLGHPTLERVFGGMAEAASTEPKTFETLAGETGPCMYTSPAETHGTSSLHLQG